MSDKVPDLFLYEAVPFGQCGGVVANDKGEGGVIVCNDGYEVTGPWE